MILYEGEEDIPIRNHNSSVVCCTNSSHPTTTGGNITVIAQ